MHVLLRPKKRWEEDIQAVIRTTVQEASGQWRDFAEHVKWWSDMEEGFVHQSKSSEVYE